VPEGTGQQDGTAGDEKDRHDPERGPDPEYCAEPAGQQGAERDRAVREGPGARGEPTEHLRRAVGLAEAAGDHVAGRDAGRHDDAADREQCQPRTGSGERRQQAERGGADPAGDDRPGGAEPAGDRACAGRAGHAAEADQAEQEADGTRTDADGAHQEQNLERLPAGQRQVADRPVHREHPQVGVAGGEQQPVADRRPQRSRRPATRRAPLALADGEQAHRRHDEGARVGEQSGHGAERLGQQPRRAGSGDPRRGPAALELGVALDEVVPTRYRRQEHHVRGGEEHRRHPGDQRDHEQLRHGQDPAPGRAYRTLTVSVEARRPSPPPAAAPPW